MATRIKIDGLEDCLKCMDAAPENLLKMSRTATRTAARATVKHIKKGIPATWRSLTSSKVTKSSDGKLSATIGLYNKQGGRSGGKTPAWFKAYWANYGTLAGRDPSHRFQYPVKHRKTAAAAARRNKGGEKARNFFEKAIVGWEAVFVEAFQQSLKQQEEKIYGTND